MPFFPDIIIIPVVFLGQILIARIFLTGGKRTLRPAVYRIVFCILCVLWASIAMEALLRFPTIMFALRGSPAIVRSVVIATANLWGMTAAFSVGIYCLYRFFSREIPVKHSPDRRMDSGGRGGGGGGAVRRCGVRRVG